MKYGSKEWLTSMSKGLDAILEPYTKNVNWDNFSCKICGLSLKEYLKDQEWVWTSNGWNYSKVYSDHIDICLMNREEPHE